MNWRWIAATAVLAAVALGFEAYNRRAPITSGAANAPTQPGYYLKDAVITQTQANGRIGIRLLADMIEQRSVNDSIALTDVRVNYFQSLDKEWLLTAERAAAPPESRVITFFGDVHLRPADAAQRAFLKTEALALDTEANVARSVNSPTRLQLGEHSMTVQNFTADLTDERIRLDSVNGRFANP